MKAAVVHPGELGAGEEREWQALARASGLGSPFTSWQFTRVVGRVRPDARVGVVDGSEGRAFLAFQVGDDGAGRPIGATISDAQAVIAPPGWTFEASDLIRACGLRRWSFDHMTTTQPAFAAHHHARHRSPIVPLEDGHDAFLARLRDHSRDLIAQVARKRRKLSREVGPVTFEWQSEQPLADMATLQRWKSAQYAREGTWDRFAEPWIVEVLAALVDSAAPGCTGVLSAVRAGDHLVAAHFGLLGADRLSWWFPAYNPDFSRYSPGLILLLDVIAAAAARRVPALDLGRGEHGYKLRVAPDAYEVAEGEVVVDPSLPAARF